MKTRKISISLPKDLIENVEVYAGEEGVSRSKAIANILTMFFRERIHIEEGRYPTVLWKLKAIGVLKLRSPHKVGRRVMGEWIVEEF